MNPKKAFVTFCYWRLFLLKSKKYEGLCLRIEEAGLSPDGKKILQSLNPYVGIDYILYYEFIKIFGIYSADSDLLMSVYPLFQNVFEDDISKFNERVKSVISYLMKDVSVVLEPACTTLVPIIYNIISDHRKCYDREMSALDLAYEIESYLRSEVNEYEYLRFQPRECSREDISENVSSLLRGYEEDTKHAKYPVNLRMYGTVKPSTFRQALKVYTLRQRGMSFHEIARQVVPHLCTEGESLILQKNAYNAALRLYKRCEILIRNAENGIFPGIY